MNALVNDFPNKIRVGNQILEVDTDYKNCIQIILAWEDKALTNEEKAFITLERLFNVEVSEIEDKDLAIVKAFQFLNAGEEPDEDEKPKKRVYSFEKDNRYIYSAIDKTLNGRLSDGKDTHWWLFCMAFMEIPEDCMLSKIIHLRNQKNKGKMSKEERKMYVEMKDIMMLDEEVVQLTEQEIENFDAFERALKGGK